MKVTKKEVEEAVEALYSDSYAYDVHIGVEPDGDMIVAAAVMAFAPEFAQAFSIAVMSLAKKHGEVYTPYIMTKPMFEKYKAYNSFVEGPELSISGILDEEWHVASTHTDPMGQARHTVVRKQGGVVVAESLCGREIAALPDALRALKMVWSNTLIVNCGSAGKDISARFNKDECQMITDALEKAEIE